MLEWINYQKPLYDVFPNLRFQWNRLKAKGITAVLWHKYEAEMFGGHPQPPLDGGEHPVSIAMAFAKAIQLSNVAAWMDTGQMLLPPEISWEDIHRGTKTLTTDYGPDYPALRTCEYLANYGCVGREIHTDPTNTSSSYSTAPLERDFVDLREPNIPFSLRESPPPDYLLDKGTLVQPLIIRQGCDLVDSVASGVCAVVYRDQVPKKRNKYGIGISPEYCFQAQTIGGVYVTHDRKDALLVHHNRGFNNPSGPNVLHTLKGIGSPTGRLYIPDNCYGLLLSKWEEEITESYAVRVDMTGHLDVHTFFKKLKWKHNHREET